ncbi:DUF935 family protein [Flavobacterium sp.]|jgi:hypothetical protein|uniref:phage portal protein family protein n=1 Tax=Flavobacterium sp. TaxID=239 RepID=UPI0037BEEBA5
MENPFKAVYTALENRILRNADPRKLKVVAEANSSSKNYSGQLDYESVTMQSKNLAEWKSAIQLATDPENPDRSSLRTLYENLLLDNHLASVIDSRILFCQRSTFKIVSESGEENEELSKLFERTWFEELVRLILMARFQGTTLIELFDVDEMGELLEVNEIPLGYFNPKKGIITKTPGEDKGWPYKDGTMANYYLQVGKDKDLGMLAQVAPIVLAKKLGIGAWLDFVEKYGVPPLFITTDREDDNRLNQLFEAAQSFKSNHFMVGRGNEKFEVPSISSNNPSGAFDPLVERANSEISKRFLGGTGLTDEKGFVGSVEIQFKLAKDRFESDKLMIKNVMNKLVFIRLIKLSPVYSALSNHYFEWDNAEIRTSKETAELVNILGNQFEIDPEWVEQQTGVPILGQKASPNPSKGGEQPNQKDLELKKKVK